MSARLAETERIRHALKTDRLLLYTQPVHDLKTGEVHNYELLVRLPGDPGSEPILPNAFLYVAERSGLIQAIDGWVVRNAIRLIAEHAATRLVLSVNLSGKSINDPKLVALIERTIDDARIDPTRLIFELTETAAIANFEQAASFATRLRGRGCRFALDDFGGGFASFYYLKNFPFDYIKIDGGFIRGLVSNPMDQIVVKAIVTMAQGLGKKTVAEFVAEQDTVRPACARDRALTTRKATTFRRAATPGKASGRRVTATITPLSLCQTAHHCAVFHANLTAWENHHDVERQARDRFKRRRAVPQGQLARKSDP